MDVRLDETGRDEAAVEIEGAGLGGDLRLDGGDPAAGDPDIHRWCVRLSAGDPSAAKHEIRIQGHESSS